MYAETGLFFPYMQNFSQDFHQLDEYCQSNKTSSSMSDVVQASSISEYDLGGEGDLFKAPEPIIEEPFGSVDPMTAAISMISCGGGEDAIATQGHIESYQSEQLLSEVFNEWEKDHMENSPMEAPFAEVLEIKVPIVMSTDGNQLQVQENNLICDVVPFQKSVSSGCLNSMDWVNGTSMKPNFLDFSAMDIGSVYGMRRAFSEGDIKTLGNGGNNTSVLERQPLMITGCSSEDRKEKLSRYRNKKTKRNFGRRIKYACRKALADSQPRIRGRFAKTEESDASKRQ